MKLLGKHHIENFNKQHPQAKGGLTRWKKIIEGTEFKNLAQSNRQTGHVMARQTVRQQNTPAETPDPGFMSGSSLKQAFNTVDLVGDYTVFNVKGNHIRTITLIEYRISQVIITAVLTHEEYNQGKWKK